jgi:lipid-A-disaccharide synthase
LTTVPSWLHVFGCIGLIIFSLRFWVQWWDAERQHKSVLPESFWWLSLIGSLFVCCYFALLADWVNIVGPLCAVIPYSRNIVLLRRKEDVACDVVMIAGEASGDQIGGPVARQLFEKRRDLTIGGIAGPSMRSAGVKPWLCSESFQVMGIVDVVKKGLFLWYAIRKIVRKIMQSKATVVVTIDQPSLALAIAKRLRSRGYKGTLIQVVAPTVWAYRPERVKQFSSYFDAIVPLFAFEVPFFKESLATHWSGHPVIEKVTQGVLEERKYLTLFPGSRPGEVKRNLHLQLQAAKLLAEDHVAIVLGQMLPQRTCRKIRTLARAMLGDRVIFVEFDNRYSIMRQSKAAITKSGTVTLELALLGVPFVCCYVTGIVTRLYARYVMGVLPQLFALPNVLLGKEVFPECILPPVTPTRVAAAIAPYCAQRMCFPDVAKLLPQLDPGSPPSARIAYFIGQKI